MLKKQVNTYLPYLLLILTIWSIAHYIPFPVTNTFLNWVLCGWITVICIWFLRKTKSLDLIDKPFRILFSIYFFWVIICTVRGFVMCVEISNYWIWKNLGTGILSLCAPLIVFVMASPNVMRRCVRVWLKYAIIIFFLLLPFIPIDSYNFFLAPLFLLGCFLPLLSKRWKVVFIALLVLMLFVDFGARSQVIKSAVTLMVAISLCFHHLVGVWLLKVFHWAFYVSAIVLLLLGITGRFNILEDTKEKNEGKIVEHKIVEGKLVEDDAAADTRTFIYEEVIKSAVKHNYVLFGRTPARGNDSRSFGRHMGEELKTGFYERHSNELVHTTIFTWLGLVGVVLYTFLYLRASWLAVYRSQNYYIKLFGCLVAFRWFFGWIEDPVNFNMLNISLWTMIAMCCSNLFRQMTNKEVEAWVKSLF